MLSALLFVMIAAGPQAGQAAAGAALRGVVHSSTGQPIAGASVAIRQDRRVQTTTDASGAFELAGAILPASIEISAPGYLTLQTTVTAPAVEVTLYPAAVHASVVVQEAGRSSDLPAPDALSRRDLDAIPALTPDDSLRALSGFSLFRRSAARASNPTTHGVTMRGLSASGASRGLVLLEGVPLNDGFGGWVTWTRVPMLALAEIDVDRGAAGDTFGSDALGGVFRLTAGSAADRLVRAGVEGGSSGLGSVDLSGNDRRGPAVFFGAASWLRTDGVIPLEPASRGAVDVRADAEWFNALGKVTSDARAGRFSLSAWGGTDDRGNGTRLQRNRMSGGTVAGSFARATAVQQFAARVSISPNSFDQTFTSVAASRATETLTSTQAIESDVVRAIGEYSRAVPRGIVVARATMSRASADFTDVRPASTITQDLRDDGEALSVHAGFAPAGRLSLGAGVRHEWRAAPHAGDGRNTATIGHASAAWQPTPGLTARASIATSHRWPTLNELVRNFQVGAVLTLANPLLAPERARSAEVSLTASRRTWTATGTVFTTTVRDAIANVTQSTTRRQRQNAGDARATGVELEAGLRPIAALWVRASATFTDATFRNSLEPPIEGKRLPQVPRSAFALSADAALPQSIRASLLWRATASQFDDDRNAFELKKASQVDLRVSGRVSRLGWHAVLENAFDSRIEVGRTPLVTLAPGRSFRAGVSISWSR